jgi:hypothetical protein
MSLEERRERREDVTQAAYLAWIQRQGAAQGFSVEQETFQVVAHSGQAASQPHAQSAKTYHWYLVSRHIKASTVTENTGIQAARHSTGARGEVPARLHPTARCQSGSGRAAPRSRAPAGWRPEPVARPGGLGADYTERLRRAPAIAGIVVGVLLATIELGWWVVPAVAAVAVTTLAVGVLARRKIGGIVGDVLGAAEQIGESVVLVVAAAVTHRHGIWPWWR